jgi:fumarate reductase flavoprotein subunit
MWEKVGIIRDWRGLAQAQSELAALETALDDHGLGDHNRAFNLSWHDWMNLKSLVSVSRAIAEAAAARSDSRGAHFRADFPESGPLETSAFTSIRLHEEGFQIDMKPVAFTRVQPGHSLLRNVA